MEARHDLRVRFGIDLLRLHARAVCALLVRTLYALGAILCSPKELLLTLMASMGGSEFLSWLIVMISIWILLPCLTVRRVRCTVQADLQR